ncbi:hypothetical protein JWH11_20055 [Xanthomonas melonis]|uniref:Uncharacterized protein n=1 Tax=Xanthomonas melonis TaxID=56456 RepID=A0ABS8P018_9XANT|nr:MULTISPECIES: hypothetical protein [Xanthomonas]MCC4586133.1 hypothetical protein [Xanthomonas sp. NCPPB 1067]MCD0260403.1 hypothetical protein [Xanthomonas melonis]MCD0268687.1 hypothetical protein [Xanthomonas melonis]MCD0279696.1 hypothetical protein [Xanthomonas melonis]
MTLVAGFRAIQRLDEARQWIVSHDGRLDSSRIECFDSGPSRAPQSPGMSAESVQAPLETAVRT